MIHAQFTRKDQIETSVRRRPLPHHDRESPLGRLLPGVLAGALVAGTALPHLVRALGATWYSSTTASNVPEGWVRWW
jgi:hypothetical protein